MTEEAIENGTIRCEDGHKRIYFDGYWIRYYTPPEETPANQQSLIISLSKRCFHHTERGINTPGIRLDQARAAWEEETDPDAKRVNAAMLAGALFNRATDIFTTIVELDNKGVNISRQNELMKSCSELFQEALEVGKQVRHYSGEEGIDELWGEPFKAFTMTIADFYHQRYIKIAMAMRDIDAIADEMARVFCQIPAFQPLQPLLLDFAESSRADCETNKTDPCIFKVWPSYVAAGEKLTSFQPSLDPSFSASMEPHLQWALQLIQSGKQLMCFISGARVPMPVSTKKYIAELNRFSQESAPHLPLKTENTHPCSH